MPIPKGTPITRDMLRVQGPGKEVPPHRMHDLIGRRAQRDLVKGDFFLDQDLNGGPPSGFSHAIKGRWGLICRFSDMDDMLAYKPRLIEFHLAERDVHLVPEWNGTFDQELVVHTPEYIGEHLLDLCSTDGKILDPSLSMVQRTMELTHTMAPHFAGRPKVIVHPGAMSLNQKAG